ncbi:hypothetical protein [Sinorhizobium fredii]|uniref:hypothetical protein n=1 Tax=Rhizobium fredii TaxID=380 RepID=UPI003397D7F9
MQPSNPESYVIIGLESIGRLFGVTGRTIKNWIRKEGFPAARLPDGRWSTTLGNVDRWLLARNEIDPYGRNGKQPVQLHETYIEAHKAAAEISQEELQAILASAGRAA